MNPTLDDTISDFEYRGRTVAYEPDPDLHAQLDLMNDALSEVSFETPAPVTHPVVFIFGIPRSGTTLTYQLVAHGLQLGYISNLAARFWRAPWFGRALEQALFPNANRDSVFESDYGKSEGLLGPHEFAFFWQEQLQIRTVRDLVEWDTPNQEIDWDDLARTINQIAEAFDRPLVFKTNYAGQFLPWLAEALPNSVFVYAQRSEPAVAASIASARRAYYGSLDRWWSTPPPEYEELRTKPYADQIAGQIFYLGCAFDQRLAEADPERVIRIDYESLCANPAGTLGSIAHRINARSSTDLQVDPHTLPELKARGSEGEADRAIEEILDALARLRNG